MKRLLFTVMLCVAASAAAAETKAQLDNKVRKLISRLELLQANPELAVPADKLQKAVGVILMDRTKGGLVFGYERGSGVAMVKDKSGKWSPFSFMTSNEGSFGAQIGGKNTFALILLMNDAVKQRLVASKVDFGGEAGGTAGDTSGSTNDNAPDTAPVLVYGISSGVYGGATVKGGNVSADDKANENYYGQFYSINDILFEGKVKPSETAVELAKKIAELSKPKQ